MQERLERLRVDPFYREAVVRDLDRLQAELDDLRRNLRERPPRSAAEDFIRATAHRDFSE